MCYSMFIPGKAGLCILLPPQKAIICNCPLPCVLISPGLVYNLQGCTQAQLTAPSYQICEGTFIDLRTLNGIFQSRHETLLQANSSQTTNIQTPPDAPSQLHGVFLTSNNKKIKHNQLFIMWGLIIQTGNYLSPFILPFFWIWLLNCIMLFKNSGRRWR